MSRKPGIEGGLRLLKEGDVFKAGGSGRLDRQFPGHGVERRGDGEVDFLVFEPVGFQRAGDFKIPGVAKMTQINARRLDRREFFDLLGSVPRQDRAARVDPRM